MLSGMKIIDFHCHPFLTEDENICIYRESVNTPDAFAARLYRSGVDSFAGSVVKRGITSFAEIKKLNDDALRLREYYKGIYYPGIHIHPSFTDESFRELDRMSAEGVTLVGELVPYMMGWNAGYASAAEILSYAGSLGMTVSAHPTDDADMEEVLRLCPSTRFVFAHPGEYGEYMKHLERIEKYGNCCIDICGTGLFRYGMLAYGIKRVGSERLLFGTDFPICSVGVQTGGVLAEGVSAPDLQNIFSLNALNLL